jgi:hypothetical protein
MEKLRNLWIWMIAVMVIMQAGIAIDYWGDFASNTWAVHIHYWNATAWYAFLIIQPWMAAKGRIEAHRTWGMIGLMLAGGMVLLSVGQLNRDIVFANFTRDNPEQMGPFEPWFFFQIMMVEMILISAFAVAVVMAIIKRKSLQDHAWWLASTAFVLIMPALGRGIQNAWIMLYGFKAENRFILTEPLYLAQTIIIALTFLFAWRFDKLRHPATWLTVVANATLFVMEPIARDPEIQNFWRTLIAH